VTRPKGQIRKKFLGAIIIKILNKKGLKMKNSPKGNQKLDHHVAAHTPVLLLYDARNKPWYSQLYTVLQESASCSVLSNKI